MRMGYPSKTVDSDATPRSLYTFYTRALVVRVPFALSTFNLTVLYGR